LPCWRLPPARGGRTGPSGLSLPGTNVPLYQIEQALRWFPRHHWPGHVRQGVVQSVTPPDDQDTRAVVERVKAELQEEMGLMPLSLIPRAARQLCRAVCEDKGDSRTYGTAGYLGMATSSRLKHAVSGAMESGDAPIATSRCATAICARGLSMPGDAAGEVDPGDWPC